jgi:hypothetical protein
MAGIKSVAVLKRGEAEMRILLIVGGVFASLLTLVVTTLAVVALLSLVFDGIFTPAPRPAKPAAAAFERFAFVRGPVTFAETGQYHSAWSL